MQKVYLDLGSHLGDGITNHIPIWKIDSTWKIIAFEANPFTYAKLIELKNNNRSESKLDWINWPGLEIVNAAIWVKDGYIDFGCTSYNFSKKDLIRNDVQSFITESSFNLNTENRENTRNLFAENIDGSSSIFYASMSKFLSKKGDDIQKKIVVSDIVTTRSIDLAKYLENNFQNGEEIYCKMDIEQAEFKVLLKLIRTKAISKIKVLDIEWHDYSNVLLKLQKIYIKFRLKIIGVQVNDWV